MEKKFEVRDDEEQEEKCNQVMELLVTSGYFRARIKGLDNFDKVVGGLVWCIDVCNVVDIDVDLLFQEDLSIGKKIALTEKIVRVVQQMECPFDLEPHQIQGLDYIHIFPVVQWLVRKVLQTREDQGDKIRQVSLDQYNNLPGAKQNAPEAENLDSLEQKPSRIYRLKETIDTPDLAALTLLEYGQRKVRAQDTVSDVIEPTTSEARLDVTAVTNLVDKVSLSRAAEAYAELKDEHLADPRTLVSAIQIMSEQKEAFKTRLEAIHQETEALEPFLAEANLKIDTLEAELNTIDHKLAEVELSATDEELLNRLQSLVAKNERLKKTEAEFKEQCRAEMEVLIKENELLEQELEQLKSEAQAREPSKAENEADLELLKKLRMEIADKGQRVQLMERQLDDIPSRYELSQYQKRFVELEDQVQAEYAETQQFVILFNVLQDQRTYLEREVKLLNSIHDCIPDAKLSSAPAKLQFINQLEQSLIGVKHSKSKAEGALKDYQRIQDAASDDLSKLMEQQRLYTTLVRDMQEEISKLNKIE